MTTLKWPSHKDFGCNVFFQLCQTKYGHLCINGTPPIKVLINEVATKEGIELGVQIEIMLG
jgi:hypothetical protein